MKKKTFPSLIENENKRKKNMLKCKTKQKNVAKQTKPRNKQKK